MKLLMILIIVFSLLIPHCSFTQNSEKARISEIEQEISKAVDKGDYEKAASLKKEKETLEAIIVALENGDYEKAANLKEGLETGSSGNNVATTKSRLNEVEDEISKAVDAGDYEKAAELKKEKELLEELIVAQENGDSAKIDELQSKLLNGTASPSGSNKEVSPEFVNQVYIWDKNSNELESLEKQKGTIETSTSASPFHAKSTSFYKVDGEYSSIRKNNDNSFVIKVMNGQDPRDLVELILFKPGKDGKDRYMPYYESSGYAYGGSSGEVKDIKIPISIKKVKDQIYEIIPDETLKNGEYGYKVIDKFYCFGVGPKGAQSKDQGNATPVREEEPRKTEPNRNKLTKNGYFIDALLGFGSSSSTGLSFVPGFKMGTKFLKNNKGGSYIRGFQLVYARVQVAFNGFGFNWANISPFGIGYTSIKTFNEDVGLEINANVMLNINPVSEPNSTSSIPYGGVLFNPEVKFRYKALAVGIDIGLTAGGDTVGEGNGLGTTGTFSASIGCKF
ncbi:MAG: UvrB/UvrC motif-containing protein [Brumimicrobium sp.]